jgi:hypothetical protein
MHLDIYHGLQTEVQFVGYSYIMDLIIAWNMEHIKIAHDTSYNISILYNFRKK